jgi:hypothetical protein
VEFSRVLAFSDGVFAIAMTLLVVGIAVPTLSDGRSTTWPRTSSASSSASASSGDTGSPTITSSPCWRVPTAGWSGSTSSTSPSSPSYRFVAIVSGLEVVLFRHAHLHGLLKESMPPEVYRWGVIGSLSPVAFFLASVPVAFVSTTAAVGVWFLGIPYGMLADRWKPAGADRFFAP